MSWRMCQDSSINMYFFYLLKMLLKSILYYELCHIFFKKLLFGNQLSYVFNAKMVVKPLEPTKIYKCPSKFIPIFEFLFCDEIIYFLFSVIFVYILLNFRIYSIFLYFVYNNIFI